MKHFILRISWLIVLAFSLAPQAAAQSYYQRELKGYDDGITQKWEARVTGGLEYGSFDDLALLLDVGAGYNFTPNVYVGLSTGMYPYFGVVKYLPSCVHIPILADVTLRYNKLDEHWSYFWQMRTGCLLPVERETINDNGDPYTRRPYVVFEAGPGLTLRPSRALDVNMSVGASFDFARTDDWKPKPLNHNQRFLYARVGFSFRGKPTSPTRTEMIAEQRKVIEQRHKEYEEAWRAKQQQEDEERRIESEARAEQRRYQDAAGEQPALQLGRGDEAKMEFFCHVTPAMVSDGASLSNDLIRLATLAVNKEVTSIVVLGLDPNARTEELADAVVRIENADKVSAYLSKRYVISHNLLSTVFSGFEESSDPKSRPSGAIATIMVQRAEVK